MRESFKDNRHISNIDQNTKEQLESRIDEVEFMIKMMKEESVTEYGQGHMGFLKIREKYYLERIKELKREREEF